MDKAILHKYFSNFTNPSFIGKRFASSKYVWNKTLRLFSVVVRPRKFLCHFIHILKYYFKKQIRLRTNSPSKCLKSHRGNFTTYRTKLVFIVKLGTFSLTYRRHCIYLHIFYPICRLIRISN